MLKEETTKLLNSEEDVWFSSALRNLMSAHLGFDPSWPSRERWEDCITWLSLSKIDSTSIKGIGTLWWGFTNNIGGAQLPDPMEAEIHLTGVDESPVSYSIKLWSEGLCRSITPAGVSVSPDKLNISIFSEMLTNKKGADERFKADNKRTLGLIGISSDLRFSAARTLSRAGEEGVRALVEAMKHTEGEIRVAALHGLRALDAKPEGIAIEMLAALKDEEFDVRYFAACILWETAYQEDRFPPEFKPAVPVLLEALKDWHYRNAPNALAWIAARDKTVVSSLIGALKDDKMRRGAIVALWKTGKAARKAAPALRELFYSKNADERSVAISALWSIDPQKAQKYAFRFLNSEKKNNIEFAAFMFMALCRLEDLDVELDAAELKSAIRENGDNSFVRNILICAMAKFVSRTEEIDSFLNSHLPALVEDLKSPHCREREKAAEALALFGPAAKPALRCLMEVLMEKDQHSHTRLRIIDAIKSIGPDESVIALCADIIKLKECSVMSETIEKLNAPSEELTALLADLDRAPIALSTIVEVLERAGPQAMQLLMEIGKGEGYEASKAIEAIGGFRETATSALVELIKAETPNAYIAFNELAKIGEASVPVLIELLNEGDRGWRSQAMEALAKIGPKAAPAIPELAKIMSDADALLSRNAIDVLAEIGPEAIPALSEGFNSTEPLMLCWTITAFEKMGEAALEAVPEIVKAADHEDPKVRFFADRALQKICGR